MCCMTYRSVSVRTFNAECHCMLFFFFNDTATTEIYTLSLHDALPIYLLQEHLRGAHRHAAAQHARAGGHRLGIELRRQGQRSEEHTSELQSRQYIVCRLLLEKKKNHLHHLRTRI